MKRGMRGILLFLFLVLLAAYIVIASYPIINSILLEPDLDLSYFGSYNITANVTNSSPLDSVTVNISIINGDGNPCGQFYANGSCSESSATTYNMSYASQDIWRRTGIRPDNIYPQIEFAKDSVFWYNTAQNTTLTKDYIHLMHFTNNYSDDANMSFWIEFDAAPANPTLTKDLVVYVIERGHDISYFSGSDWRNNADEVSLVATLTRTTPKGHTHTANSSHYLITLSADNNGTIGSEHVNVSGDFWIALYSNAPANQGWNLRYRNDSLCNNSGRWYTEQQGTWSPQNISGCPDAHIHLARRVDFEDGVQLAVTANYTDGNSTTNTTNVTFGDLPNLPPVPTAFTYPQNGTYSGVFNITWIPASDPNGDPVTYNLSLLNADGTFNQTLNTSTNLTYFTWNSSTVPDGTYDLMVVACDPSNACSNFTLGGLYNNFTIDNIPQYNFTNISMTKTDSPDPVNASSVLTYQINFTITGNGSGRDVFFQETYPDQIIYLNASPSPNIGNKTWTFGDLPNGTTRSINITVFVRNVSNNTVINNSVQIFWQNETGIFYNSFTVTQSTTVILQPSPFIQLLSPGDSAVVTSSPTVEFTYNVSDATVQNCSLYINGILNQTDTSITPDTVQSFNATLQNGNYNWSISCINSLNMANTSQTYTFTLSYSPPSPSGGGGGGGNAARSYYSYVNQRRQLPRTQTRTEETAMLDERASQQEIQEKTQTAKAPAQSGITGNAVRAPVASEYAAVETESSQSTIALMIALLLAAAIGAVVLVNINQMPKNHVVVKLHKDGKHSDLVIKLNREHHKKKQK
jgi:hypothetical protein